MNPFKFLYNKYKNWKKELDENIRILNEQQRIQDMNRIPYECRFCREDHPEIACPWVL